MNKIISLSRQEQETIQAALCYWHEKQRGRDKKEGGFIYGDGFNKCFDSDNFTTEPLDEVETALLISRMISESNLPHIAVIVEGGVVSNVLVAGELDQVPVTVIDYDTEGNGKFQIPLAANLPDDDNTENANVSTFYPERGYAWLRKALSAIEKQREEGGE